MRDIYKLTSPSGKTYIGQTREFKQRMYEFKCEARDRGSNIYVAVRKYGWESFTKELVLSCYNKNADMFEIHLIKMYTLKGLSYNSQSGGRIGYTLDKKTCDKIANNTTFLRGEDHHNYGKSHSDETKEKMRCSHKGHKHSVEARINMSKAQRATPRINHVAVELLDLYTMEAINFRSYADCARHLGSLYISVVRACELGFTHKKRYKIIRETK